MVRSHRVVPPILTFLILFAFDNTSILDQQENQADVYLQHSTSIRRSHERQRLFYSIVFVRFWVWQRPL